jgi:hypothetical protein
MAEKLIDGEVSVDTSKARENLKKLDLAAMESSALWETLGEEMEQAVAEGAKAAKKAADDAAKAASDAAKALQKLRDDAENAREKSSELFTKGIGGGEAAEKIKSISDGFKIAGDKANDMGTRVRAAAGSVGIMGRMVAGAASEVLNFVREVGEATARVDQHQRMIRALGESYQVTNALTQGAMNAAEQFAVREQLLAHNTFLRTEQTATLNRAMREFAAIHGGEASAAMQRFTQAVEQGDNVALAQFNVHLDASVPAARRMQAAIDQLASAQRDTPIVPPTETERQRSFTQWLGDTTDALYTYTADGLNPNREAMREWAQNVTTVTRSIQEQRQQLLAQQQASDQVKNAIANINHVLRDQFNQNLTNAGLLVASITARVVEYTTALNRASNASQRFAFNADMGAEQNASRLMGAQQLLANLRSQRASDRTVRREMRLNGATNDELSAIGLGGGSSGGAAANLADLKRGVSEAINEIGRLGGTWELLQRQRGETEEHFWHRYEEHAQGALEHARQELEITRSIEDHHRALLQVLRDEKALKDADVTVSKDAAAGTTRAGTYYTKGQGAISGGEYGADSDQLRQMQQASDYSQQFAQTFGATAENIQTTAQTTASIVGQAWGAMTGSFKSHLGALIEGKEDAAAAFGGMLHEALLSIAEESTIQALFNGAKAVAALASQQYAQAGQFATAAAMYAGVAVATGLGAAATTPRSAGAGAGGGFTAGATSRSAGTGPSNDNGTGGSVTNIINITGLAMTRRDAQDGVGRALDGYGMRNRTLVSNRRRAA